MLIEKNIKLLSLWVLDQITVFTFRYFRVLMENSLKMMPKLQMSPAHKLEMEVDLSHNEVSPPKAMNIYCRYRILETEQLAVFEPKHFD